VPETGSLAGDLSPFQTFMRERMSAALDEHLEALGQARSVAGKPSPERRARPWAISLRHMHQV
jgi:hypothetical protein